MAKVTRTKATLNEDHMSDDFSGAGAPPPPTARSGGDYASRPYDPAKPSPFPEHGFYEPSTYKGTDGQRRPGSQRVMVWRCDAGQDGKEIILLDGLPTEASPRRSIRYHDFTGRDGKFGNMVISPQTDDRAAADPLCMALAKTSDKGDLRPAEPKWGWLLTGISLRESSKKTGKVFLNTRSLLIVPANMKDQFLAVEKLARGFRGLKFKVSRPKENPIKTPKIGQKWDPQDQRYDDAQLHAMFAASAADYGIPVEQFCSPYDYTAIFKPKSLDELEKIAGHLKGVVNQDNSEHIGSGAEPTSLKF